MVGWRYEISFLVFNSISHERAQGTSMPAGMNSLREGVDHIWELYQRRQYQEQNK